MPYLQQVTYKPEVEYVFHLILRIDITHIAQDHVQHINRTSKHHQMSSTAQPLNAPDPLINA